MTDGRPGVDRYFMDMTHLVKSRGTCPRRQVGAVVVKDKHVLTTGYNGAPKRFPHPIDTGCIRDELGIPSGVMADVCPCLHAEQNALLQAASFGVSIAGADLYCTTQPCTQCSRMIANCGLRRVVFEEEYAAPLAIGLLTTAGVELWRYDGETGKAQRYLNTNTWEQAQEELRGRWRRGEMGLPMADQPAHPLGTAPIAGASTPAPAEVGAAGAEAARAEQAATAPDAGGPATGDQAAEPAAEPKDTTAEADEEAEPMRVRDLSEDPERDALIKRLARQRVERERQRKSDAAAEDRP